MIYKYADIASLLMLSKKKPDKLEWNNRRKQAFENLKAVQIFFRERVKL